MRDLADDAHVREVGLSGDEIAEMLTEVPARNILVIMDSCQSGAVLGNFESFGQRRAMESLSDEAGVVVIAATRSDQLAPEYGFLGHGLMTYVLLQGVQREGTRFAADLSPRDGRLTAGELKAYVESRAPELAAELDQRIEEIVGTRGAYSSRVPTTPVGLVLGEDFTVAR
jgi:uncharacterized caspase-like protein